MDYDKFYILAADALKRGSLDDKVYSPLDGMPIVVCPTRRHCFYIDFVEILSTNLKTKGYKMIRYRFMPVLLLVFGLMTMGLGLERGRAADVPRMDKEQLKAQLGDKDLIILDVRTESDWKSSQSKIPGAMRESPNNAEAWLGKYPKDKTIVLYCA